MELDTIRLHHSGWTHTNGWTSQGRIYKTVSVVPDRDAKVFDSAGYVPIVSLPGSRLQSHKEAFPVHKISGSGLFILAEDLPYVDYDTCADAYWFHSSNEGPADFFESDYQDTHFLHVGRIHSALERRVDRSESGGLRPWIHVFKIKNPRKNLMRLWKEDFGDPEPVNSNRISRYVNTYERPGSVSLVGSTKCFEMVDSIDVDGLGGVYEFDDLPTHYREKLLPYV